MSAMCEEVPRQYAVPRWRRYGITGVRSALAYTFNFRSKRVLGRLRRWLGARDPDIQLYSLMKEDNEASDEHYREGRF